MIPFITRLDTTILTLITAHRDLGHVMYAIALTELGSTVTISGLSAVVFFVLVYRRHITYAGGLVATILTSTFTFNILKYFIHRARPGTLQFGTYVESGYSFPSGHATMSMALYGFLIFLIWHMMPAGKLRVFMSILLSILILGIGYTRVYLGVHYPTDVLAGFMIGGVFIWIGAWVSNMLARRMA
jgi:undecaprenyl-diphosphatase